MASTQSTTARSVSGVRTLRSLPLKVSQQGEFRSQLRVRGERYQVRGIALGYFGVILIAASLATLPVSPACAQSAPSPATLRDTAHGIEISLPDGYVTRELGDSNALDPVKVALAPVGGGFPTLNIIVHPPLAAGRPAEEQILDEYRLAGFTDVRLARKLDAPSHPWVAIELEYTQGGAPFTAYVGTRHGSSRSHLVTALAPRAQSEEALTLFTSVTSAGLFDGGGISSGNGDALGVIQPSRTMATLALLAATLFAVWYWRVHHRRKKRLRAHE